MHKRKEMQKNIRHMKNSTDIVAKFVLICGGVKTLNTPSHLVSQSGKLFRGDCANQVFMVK